MVLDEPKETDEVFDSMGLSYLVEKDLYNKVKPIKVDYVNSAFGAGFQISSSLPQGGSCGQSCSC